MRLSSNYLPRAAVVAFVAASLTLACRDNLPTQPQQLTGPLRPAFSTYDASTRTLGVSLNVGPSRWVGTEYRTVSASVSGGNGTYYYEWYVQSCYPDYCDDQYLYDYGWGVSSTPMAFYSDELKRKITVQVWDSQDLPFSGSDWKTRIGPPPPTVTGDFACQLGNEHYPIHDLDPATQTYVAYYRDGCTGARVYDPTNPHTF